MTDRYICIHGHFYQPPRENPWLEAIELQDSAYPYHDWNERITYECYAPNGAARILDDEKRIVAIVNNYARISFNIGPTLLAWLERHGRDVHDAIVAADRESRERFSGHGSAMAQPYNHMILPLASPRDRRTQVRWGIRDFERRFGRAPEGMWLPETAVDVASLEVLAEHEIRFTVLAPSQARRVRRIGATGAKAWHDVDGGRIDPTLAYEAVLPSGRRIALFFYDGPVARAVAFEGLLASGESFASRLQGAFSKERTWPQLAHIATDGESYGHHHRFGEMALAFALDLIEKQGSARLTNYGEFLERHPPTHEVEVVERTAWSCVHGVGRWMSACGCNSGGHPGWNQEWRAPLRAALDWLRDTLAPVYERRAGEWLSDPWAARDDYADIVLERTPERLDRFFEKHAPRPMGQAERVEASKLLEMQRHAMLMYTSCGWFFDEISGIETVQVMQYAGRAIQLAESLSEGPFEAGFLDRLASARSNVPEHENGARVYEKMVKPAMVDLPAVTAHYALSSLFEKYAPRAQIHAYTIERQDGRQLSAGKRKLAYGRVRVRSDVTGERATLAFGVVHLGDHNLHGAVRALEPGAYGALVKRLEAAFGRADVPETLRLLDRDFDGTTYSLRRLFRDEQRKILGLLLESTLAEAEAVYRQVYEHHAPLLRFLGDLSIPCPPALLKAAELVLTGTLRRALEAEPLDLDRIRTLLDEARTAGISLDDPGLGFALERTVDRVAARLAERPGDAEALRALDGAIQLARALPFAVDLWNAQNVGYRIVKATYPERRAAAERGDAAAKEWTETFRSLGKGLALRVD